MNDLSEFLSDLQSYLERQADPIHDLDFPFDDPAEASRHDSRLHVLRFLQREAEKRPNFSILAKVLVHVIAGQRVPAQYTFPEERRIAAGKWEGVDRLLVESEYSLIEGSRRLRASSKRRVLGVFPEARHVVECMRRAAEKEPSAEQLEAMLAEMLEVSGVADGDAEKDNSYRAAKVSLHDFLSDLQKHMVAITEEDARYAQTDAEEREVTRDRLADYWAKVPEDRKGEVVDIATTATLNRQSPALMLKAPAQFDFSDIVELLALEAHTYSDLGEIATILNKAKA